MNKILVTESQLKAIINHNINEQSSKMILPGGSAEGVIKISNGKYFVIASSEMGNQEKLGPFTFKVPVKDGQKVFINNTKGMILIYGPNPKNPKGDNIRYN